MNVEMTSIANDVIASDNRAKYDAEVKNLLSNKIILAWIVKYTTKEFRDYSVETIVNCIEGKPEVATVAVDPGLTNAQGVGKITGSRNEDCVPNEGAITFDIRFFVITPEQERIKLIVNVEAQKSFNPSYDIVTRSIYYCARMLSAQKNTEFSNSDYDSIKKVYSIWLCMDVPKEIQNTITEFSIAPKQVYGNFDREVRYDLLSSVFVCLGNVENSENGLIDLLATLLSMELPAEEKLEQLEIKFNIKTHEIIKGVTGMCNLSELVEEKGIEKGRAEGRTEGRVEGINALVETMKEFNFSADSIIKKVIEKFGLSEAEARKYV